MLRADDHGITVGDGVFETMKVIGGAAVRDDAATFAGSRRPPPDWA